MSQPRSIGDLNQNPKNPRKITEAKLLSLKKSLQEFGDLSGFVFNKRSEQLVGGHQRAQVIPKASQIIVTNYYEPATKNGTTAVGYVVIGKERFAYREVDWPEAKERAANIAANKGAGDWDNDQLAEWMQELEQSNFDLDLTMFDEEERANFINSKRDVEFQASDEPSIKKEGKKSVCPNCGEAFTVAGRV